MFFHKICYYVFDSQCRLFSPFGVTSVLIEADRCMDINYKKLRKLLIDRDMKKKGLEKAAGISNYVISKMNRNEKITVETVGKICKALSCTPNDIMDFVYDNR